MGWGGWKEMKMRLVRWTARKVEYGKQGEEGNVRWNLQNEVEPLWVRDVEKQKNLERDGTMGGNDEHALLTESAKAMKTSR